MPSKPRPGVTAAINLAVQPKKLATWLKVERQLSCIPCLPVRLFELEQKELPELAQQTSLSKSNLEKLVEWKFLVGKPRPTIQKILASNSDSDVDRHTRKAIELALSCNSDIASNDSDASVSRAMAELENLKGVGPATASAVLSLICPSHFCFMYDEVIECFEKQRDYKRSTYLRVNDKCHEIANSLNQQTDLSTSSPEPWTPFRVSKVLWTACRYCACHGVDLSKNEQSDIEEKVQKEDGSPRIATTIESTTEKVLKRAADGAGARTRSKTQRK